jgi:membrane-bound lytic murein transglycosylase D
MGYRSLYLLLIVLFSLYGCHHQVVQSSPIPQDDPAETATASSDKSDRPGEMDTTPSSKVIWEDSAGASNETIQHDAAEAPLPPPLAEASGETQLQQDEDISEIDLPRESAVENLSVKEPAVPISEPSPPEKINAGPMEPAVEKKKPQKKSALMILDEALVFCQTAQEFWQKGELENALEALDQAYSLILEIDVNELPEIIQQKEDIRFLISKRILEIYASRNIVVNGNYDAIPMEMNKYVRAELNLFSKGNEKKFFRQSYIRSGKYRPLIVSKLKEAGIPEELSWLPLIESGFKVKAMSKARALGLWQFIPSTGYKFGLKRNQYIDERIDPEKSTDAAIAYLKELHKIFGDWTTVLAAYNCGEGRVLRVIRSQNVNYLDNFWDLYERLPRETARYVPRFLAAIHIIKNPATYGIDSIVPDKPLEYEIVEVNRQVQLTDIARKIKASGQELKELNPELRYNILPPEKYALKVPPANADLLLAAIDTIPISSPPRPAYVIHRVRKGETLSGIAMRYRTSVGRIMRANNIRKSSFIVAGKKLKIPQRGTIIARADTSVKVSTGTTFVHRVRSGDSLWNLAKRYGTTTQKIQSLNGMRDTNLYIGQKLSIPEYRIVQQPGKGDKNQYLVRRGDSPYKIARRHNMSLASLLRINGLTPRSKIYPGQLLLVE